jgi:RNA polymerase sigma-70 factor (sigma-E family)
MRPEQEREYVEYVSVRLPRLHRLAYLLCADAHQADDIVQAALTSLYLGWRRASKADSLDAYVNRIVVRRYLDEKRRRWSRVLLGDALPDVPAADGAGGIEQRDELVNALRALPEGQRAVLVLRFLGDLSVEATAEALGCSAGNVKSQSSRGLATLRGVLQRDASGRGAFGRSGRGDSGRDTGERGVSGHDTREREASGHSARSDSGGDTGERGVPGRSGRDTGERGASGYSGRDAPERDAVDRGTWETGRLRSAERKA